MNIHEGKGYHNLLPIVLFAVTIAENLQNMKPVQNCTSLIFVRFTRMYEGHLESSKHGLLSQLPIYKPYHVWYHFKELSFLYVMAQIS